MSNTMYASIQHEREDRDLEHAPLSVLHTFEFDTEDTGQ